MPRGFRSQTLALPFGWSTTADAAPSFLLSGPDVNPFRRRLILRQAPSFPMAAPAALSPSLHLNGCAFNGRDVEAFVGLASRSCRCYRDGEELGQGPDALRKALLDEFALNDELIGRWMVVDGQPALVEFAGEHAPEPRGVVRMRAGARGLEELHFDHDPKVVARIGLTP